jgi:Domain of unknown function (DUF6985)
VRETILSFDELLKLVETANWDTSVEVSFFDGASLSFRGSELPHDVVAHLLARFLRLSTERRLAESRHVYAYFRDAVAIEQDSEGPRWTVDALLDGKAPPVDAVDAWRLITPRHLHVVAEDGRLFVVAECECAWEPEQGLLMSFEDGERLVKVSGFDSRYFHAPHASGRLLIHEGVDAAWTTFADG